MADQVHLHHCNQGDYEGSCKYGEPDTCPVLHPLLDGETELQRRARLAGWEASAEPIKGMRTGLRTPDERR